MLSTLSLFFVSAWLGAFPCKLDTATSSVAYPPGISASGVRFLFKQTGEVTPLGWTTDGRWFAYKTKQSRSFVHPQASEGSDPAYLLWEEAIVLDPASSQRQRFLLSFRLPPKKDRCFASAQAWFRKRSFQTKAAFAQWKASHPLVSPKASSQGLRASVRIGGPLDLTKKALSWSFQPKASAGQDSLAVHFQLLRGKAIVSSHLEAFAPAVHFQARRSLLLSWAPQGASALWFWRTHTASTMRGLAGEEASFVFLAAPTPAPLPLAQIVLVPDEGGSANEKKLLRIAHALQASGFAVSPPTKAQKDRTQSVIYTSSAFQSRLRPVLRLLPGSSFAPLTWKTPAACVVALDRSFR